MFRFRLSSRVPRAAGVSLVELMVAVAVMAVLAGVGASGFAGLAARARVSGEATRLLDDLLLARAEAMKRGARVTVLPAGGDWTAGRIVFVDRNANRAADPGEPVLQRHPRMHPDTRVSVDTTPGYLAFGASGMPQQYSGAFLAGTVTLCDHGRGRSVVLARSGRPRIAEVAC